MQCLVAEMKAEYLPGLVFVTHKNAKIVLGSMLSLDGSLVLSFQRANVILTVINDEKHYNIGNSKE